LGGKGGEAGRKRLEAKRKKERKKQKLCLTLRNGGKL
jgi:hypothetical protein